MTNEQKLIWAAGFIDGEGFITIGRRGAYKGYKSLYLRLGVNHVAREPLYILLELFGGNLEFQRLEKVIGNRIPRTRWICNTGKASKALERLIPFLVNKKGVAQLGLDFQATMGTTKKTSDEMKALREVIRQEIIRTNKID
jgi:hypothetical protein